VAADIGRLADPAVLEGEIRASTWSRPSISSTSTLVMPTSGREPSTRFSSAVMRVRTASPGRTGLSQRTSSTPGDPSEAARTRKPSTSMRIMIAQVW
jgi:hypothetical protein